MDSEFPWVVSIQGIIADCLQTNPCFLYKIVAPLETQVIKKAKYVGGRTNYDKKYIQKVNPNATIIDLPEAMNECFFEKPWSDQKNQKIVFVGSGDKRKGLHRLINATEFISEQFANLKLEVVGKVSPEQQTQFKNQAKKEKIKINFLGFKKSEEIAKLHRECSLFVIPSENENSPNTLAEAMASGMPVIAYNVGGISSMIEDKKSGLLVEFGNTKKLAETIKMVLTNSNLRQNLGYNARIAAERNKPEHVAKITLEAYEKILSN